MPAVMRGVINGDWPNFTDATVSRDFVYLDDISQLIVKVIEKKDDSSKYFQVNFIWSFDS
jgi:nucleoside-diphosphate-sugar epimerase